MSGNVTAAWQIGAGVATVRLGGELDVETLGEVRVVFGEALAADGLKSVVVDLTDTEFLDSTALGVLVGAYRRARADSVGFVVVNVQGQVERLLAMTGTLDLLTGQTV